MTPPGDPWADWVTIWQSEMAAIATDRELQEAVQGGIDLWATEAMRVVARHEGEARSAGPVPASGTTSALASPADEDGPSAGGSD